MLRVRITFLFVLITAICKASSILIPMDEEQKNHLKAYGITFWTLKNGLEADWLLNYRGGSFLIKYSQQLESECKIRGVSYEVLPDARVNGILNEISDPSVNMEMVKLEKAPKIAVYSPKNKLPWDDAVTMVLTYAEIPYDILYDDEVLKGNLPKYDWLHLHHEDFTGQYNRFWGNYKNASWYIEDVKIQEETAKRNGFKKVSSMKLAVAQTIREFCAGGGFMFAMCSGPETFDVALAANGTDIVERVFDGDGSDPQAQAKLDFNQTFAFHNFKLDLNPSNNEFSTIDARPDASSSATFESDFFTLFDFSAKWDIVPAMLTQSHDKVIKGFMGQTTSFKRSFIKPHVLVMGETKTMDEAKYIHGEFGKGQWTFYGGHDPEDYRHLVGDPPTDLSLHPNSPGYRLILNNVLFPAAKKKKQKT
ncbi:MAG: asparagine synthetase B [Daejeonella sp.]|uniref:asparagine synthetase B n=1 Tax=Daejeonella sp. TaxID=2805397 RepID=UPI003C77D46D